MSAALELRAQSIRLDSPPDNAHPASSYVVIQGRAPTSTRISILDGPRVIAWASPDADGRFERIVRFVPGHHQIRLRSGSAEAAVDLDIAAYPAPNFPTPFEWMQTGDVLLAHDRGSPQDALYSPTYTHSALYIGPASDGAPMLLEAISEDNATALGAVSAIPIEQSLAWRQGDRVDLFRLAAGLAAADRARIVSWAHRIAARGVRYRSAADLGDVYRAWLLWDPRTDRPRDSAEFERALAGLRARLRETDAFDCSTLVWHAYRDNTAAHIDLASPNRIVWGGAAGKESPRLMSILQPFLVEPDSFALSGKLRQVTAE